MKGRLWEFYTLLARNGDGGGGGGAGGTGGGADGGAGGGQQQQQSSQQQQAPGALGAAQQIAGQQQQQQAGGQQQQQAGPQAYLPEGIGDDFKGTNDRETIDKLFNFVKGQEKAPAKAEDYAFTPDEKFAKQFGDLKDDPALAVFRNVALEAGLNNTQFNNVIGKFYAQLSEKGLIEPPIDGQAELDKLAPKGADQITGRRDAAVRANAVVTWLNGLANKGALAKNESEMLMALGARAEGIVALEKVMKMTGEHGVQLGGQQMGGHSRESLQQEMNDPRYDSLSDKYDPKFRERVDKAWAQTFGANV